MAICNKDFRVKHGLYVGTDIDASRGALSALSVNVGGGYGDTGLTVTATGNLSANGGGVFDGNFIAETVSAVTLSGDGRDLVTNATVTLAGDVSGSVAVSSLNGTKTINTTISDDSVTLGQQTAGDYVKSFALNTTVPTITGTVGTGEGATITGIGLSASGVTSGIYGSTSQIPSLTILEDGRVSNVDLCTISTTLSISGSSGTGSIALATQGLGVVGTANEIETAASGNAITVGLPNDVTVSNDLTVSNDVCVSNNIQTGGNVVVTGNLTVNGTTVTQDVTTVLVEDPVIKLANGNSADNKDIGFYGEYVDSGTKYAGLIRDTSFTSTNPFVFFDGTTTDVLSANASGTGKPAVANYADVYSGRMVINTSAYNASNRLTVSGAISGDNNITIDGTANFKGNVTLGDASGDTLTINAETINPANIAAGTDNTVVVYNGSSLVTDEIDSRVWGATLIDTSNVAGTSNHIAFFTDTNVIGSESSGELYWNSTNNRLGINTATPNEALTVTGNVSATGTVYADAFTSTVGGGEIDFNDNIALSGSLSFSPSSDILIPDHEGAALEIKEGSNLYQRFVTTNGSEGVEISKQLTLTMVAGTTDSVVIQDSGVIKKRDIDSRVWGSTLVDGSGTDNRLTKWTETGDTVGDSIVADDGTAVCVGVGSATGRTRFLPGLAVGRSVDFGNASTGYHSASATVNASASGAIMSIPIAQVRSAKVIVQSEISSQYEVAELLVLHNGTDTFQTEYGSITSGTSFDVSYTSRINGSNLEIVATNADGSNAATVTVATLQMLT